MPIALGWSTGPKPANIIVGKFGEVYVLDWGLAKVLGGKSLAHDIGTDDQTADLSLTRSGMHYGTYVYDPGNCPWVE